MCRTVPYHQVAIETVANMSEEGSSEELQEQEPLKPEGEEIDAGTEEEGDTEVPILQIVT